MPLADQIPVSVQSPPAIVVTAALQPLKAAEASPSLTLIDLPRIESLGQPLVADLVRTAPGVSVAVSGSRGSLTQIRIRGAEATHSLLFVDGIAFNDPASGNQARFETLVADGLAAIEINRGPQSALWGSEALGGVIALTTTDPLGGTRISGNVEYGSREAARASIGLATGSADAGIAASASWLSDNGIDILGGGGGDRDGFSNLTASLKGVAHLAGALELGLVVRTIAASSEFDGTPPPFYIRADTAERSEVGTAAGRVWLRWGLPKDSPWGLLVDAQVLRSENRNFASGTRTNDTIGKRYRAGAQLSRRLELGRSVHVLTGRVEREEEKFANVDRLYEGASDSSHERGRTAFVAEWRGNWGERLTTNLALRHDEFNRFTDATTLRASALVRISGDVSAHAAYGEGIAQPSFADLFGFAPGSGFVANAALEPETSQGFEAGLRWSRPTAMLQAVAFSNNLRGEVVEDFSAFPAYTVVNAPGKSRRRGIELSGELTPAPALRLSANYTLLDAREGGGADTLREVRRARHSGNAVAEWSSGPISLGASASFVGKRRDMDFDAYRSVTLDPYVLAGLRIGWRPAPGVEAYGRVENLLDQSYEDVVGYDNPGRSIHAGVRLRFGR